MSLGGWWVAHLLCGFIGLAMSSVLVVSVSVPSEPTFWS
jgi:hypothetical protein